MNDLSYAIEEYVNFCDSRFEDCHVCELFQEFPIGLMILQKVQGGLKQLYREKFVNKMVHRILKIDTEEQLKSEFKRFFKIENMVKFDQTKDWSQDSDNLFDLIYQKEMQDSDIQEKYYSNEILLLIKVRNFSGYKLVTIENLDEERKKIQDNITKNINSQYLITLSHELNNPMNGLINIVEEVPYVKKDKQKEDLIRMVRINILLIKFFIKNFIISLKLSAEQNFSQRETEKLNSYIKEGNSFNIEYMINSIKSKFINLYSNKNLTLEHNINVLKNVTVTYHYSYFKWFLKNIFIYIYNIVDRNEKIKINVKLENNLRIAFSQEYKTVTTTLTSTRSNLNKNNSNSLNRSFFSELNIETSVRTIDILKDVMKRLADILNIKLILNENDSLDYLEILIDYSLEFTDDLANECSPRMSKDLNISTVKRSIPSINISKKNLRITFKHHTTNYKQNPQSKDEYKIGTFTPTNAKPELNNNISIKTFSGITAETLKVLQNLKNDNNNKIHKQEPRKINKEMLNLKTEGFTLGKIGKHRYSLGKKLSNKLSNKKIKLYKDITSNSIFSQSNDSQDKSLKQSDLTNFTFKLLPERLDTLNSNEKNVISKKFPSITKNLEGESNFNAEMNFSKLFLNCFENKQSEPNIEEFNCKISSIKDRSEDLKPIKEFETFNPQYEEFHLNNQNEESEEEKFYSTNDVLVVDDESFNLKILTSLLLKKNIRADTSVNGIECLKKVTLNNYKLILMDIFMPEMNGIEASKKIQEMIDKKTINSLNIVIISAHKSEEIVDSTKKIHAVKEFVFKPVKRSKIDELLKKYYF